MTESETRFVEHGGHRIACLVRENPEANCLPVVWIHGLTASYRFWEKATWDTIDRIRSSYSVSLPLHHPSTFSGEPNAEMLDEDLFADVLEAAIGALVPQGKVHLVGHSLGGFAALNLAAKKPDRVASVMSVGGFMRGRARGLEGILQFLSKGRFFRKALFHGGFRFLQLHRNCLKFGAMTYASQWRDYLGCPLTEPTIGAIYPDVKCHDVSSQRAFFRYLLSMDLFDEIDDIRVPVLMVVGSDDPIIPPDHQIECAERLSDGRLLLLEGVGHLPFAEAYDEFEEALLKWLGDCDREE